MTSQLPHSSIIFADGIDPSRLDPRTIDLRLVGPVAALINFAAFESNECIRNAWLDPADAARGFDEYVAEVERLFGQKLEG